MRSLLLAFNILIGVSITTVAPEATAAPAKVFKSKTQKLYRGYFKKKGITNPGDVWDRVRAGMRMPTLLAEVTKPVPVVTAPSGQNSLNTAAAGTDNANLKLKPVAEAVQTATELTAIVRPHTLLPPVNNYTELGMKRLAAKKPVTSIINCKQPSPAQLRQEYALKNKARIAQLNEQIRSQIDFHPELRRRTIIMGANPLATESATQLASAPVNQMAERAQIGSLAKTMSAAAPCTARIAVPQMASVNREPAADSVTTGAIQSASVAAEPQINTRHAMINDRINRHIASYSHNAGFLYRVAERAQPYLYHIVDRLAKNGMPMELALLPIVESAYQPTAQSPKSAAGLWQFIPSTGRDFDLVQNSEYDERLDIPESTQAAIRFLSGLKDHFHGDWLLALAAYNSGQGTVDNAIARNQAAGLPTDFWSLDLPEETENYVPRLLALAHIFSHPGSYGIKLPAVRNEPYFVKVKIDRPFDINYLADKDLDTVAQLANLSREQFSRLNPGYLNSTLSGNGPYTFLMPASNASYLQSRLASIARFMAQPVAPVPVKSVILQAEAKPQPKMEIHESGLSVVNEVMSKKPAAAATFSTPFLSLSVNDKNTDLPG